MKRLSTVSLVNKVSVCDYKLPETPKTPFVVDDSAFCPMSEAVKQLSRVSPVSSDEHKMYYDFPTGRDSGATVPFERTKDNVSIVELSQNIIDSQKEVANTVEKTRKEVEKVQKINSIFNESASGTPTPKES